MDSKLVLIALLAFGVGCLFDMAQPVPVAAQGNSRGGDTVEPFVETVSTAFPASVFFAPLGPAVPIPGGKTLVLEYVVCKGFLVPTSGIPMGPIAVDLHFGAKVVPLVRMEASVPPNNWPDSSLVFAAQSLTLYGTGSVAIAAEQGAVVPSVIQVDCTLSGNLL